MWGLDPTGGYSRATHGAHIRKTENPMTMSLSNPATKIRPCPICASVEAELLIDVPASAFCEANTTYRKDWANILELSPDTVLPLVRCSTCRFVFAGHLPSTALLDTLYEHVICHDETATDRLRGRRRLIRLADRLLEAAPRLGKDATLLDYGCGYGHLAASLQSRDLLCVGFEPSPERARRARAKGVVVVENEQALAGHAPFDLLVCAEVLEHVSDPRAVVRRLRRLAKDGSVLAITVPDFSQPRLDAALSAVRAGGPAPATLNLWEHLNYFTPESLLDLVSSEGFSLCADESLRLPALGWTSGSAGLQWSTLLKVVRRFLRRSFRLRAGRACSTHLLFTADE